MCGVRILQIGEPTFNYAVIKTQLGAVMDNISIWCHLIEETNNSVPLPGMLHGIFKKG